jgi:hypothetical protein
VKAPYLFLASLALAGCSNTPSTGDVERVLETAVASCQNVEVTKVKKTNGYEKDGYYHVEYAYSLKLKDEDKLAKLKNTWLEEKQRAAEFIPARDAHEQRVHEIEEEIGRIEATFEGKRPNAAQFSSSGRPFYELPDHERRAYDAAERQWLDERSAATEGKRKEIDDLKRAWNEERAKVPSPTVLGSEGNVLYAFLSRGCSQAGWKYATGLFSAYTEAVGQANANVPVGGTTDRSGWFDKQSAEMTGVMTMHKTENGWQALSESL